jgi:hypothetical protein
MKMESGWTLPLRWVAVAALAILTIVGERVSAAETANSEMATLLVIARDWQDKPVDVSYQVLVAEDTNGEAKPLQFDGRTGTPIEVTPGIVKSVHAAIRGNGLHRTLDRAIEAGDETTIELGGRETLGRATIVSTGHSGGWREVPVQLWWKGLRVVRTVRSGSPAELPAGDYRACLQNAFFAGPFAVKILPGVDQTIQLNGAVPAAGTCAPAPEFRRAALAVRDAVVAISSQSRLLSPVGFSTLVRLDNDRRVLDNPRPSPVEIRTNVLRPLELIARGLSRQRLPGSTKRAVDDAIRSLRALLALA